MNIKHIKFTKYFFYGDIMSHQNSLLVVNYASVKEIEVIRKKLGNLYGPENYVVIATRHKFKGSDKDNVEHATKEYFDDIVKNKTFDFYFDLGNDVKESILDGVLEFSKTWSHTSIINKFGEGFDNINNNNIDDVVDKLNVSRKYSVRYLQGHIMILDFVFNQCNIPKPSRILFTVHKICKTALKTEEITQKLKKLTTVTKNPIQLIDVIHLEKEDVYTSSKVQEAMKVVLQHTSKKRIVWKFLFNFILHPFITFGLVYSIYNHTNAFEMVVCPMILVAMIMWTVIKTILGTRDGNKLLRSPNTSSIYVFIIRSLILQIPVGFIFLIFVMMLDEYSYIKNWGMKKFVKKTRKKKKDGNDKKE